MKSRCFFLLCLVLASSVANAELVIDAFDQGRGLSNPGSSMNSGGGPLGSTATDNLNKGIGGTRTATITGFGTDWREGGYVNNPSNFFNLAPKQFALRNTNGAGTLTLDYNFSSNFDFTSGASYVLLFDIFTNVTPGTQWNYTLTIADGGSTAAIAGQAAGGKALQVRASDFGGPVFASTIDRITLVLAGPNGGQILRTNSGLGAKISAVPEPFTLGLLGVTGLFGLVVARRRAKVTEVP